MLAAMLPKQSRKLHNSHSLALVLVSSSPLSAMSCKLSLDSILISTMAIVAMIPGHAYLKGALPSPSTPRCVTSASPQLHHPAVSLDRMNQAIHNIHIPCQPHVKPRTSTKKRPSNEAPILSTSVFELLAVEIIHEPVDQSLHISNFHRVERAVILFCSLGTRIPSEGMGTPWPYIWGHDPWALDGLPFMNPPTQALLPHKQRKKDCVYIGVGERTVTV